jgi:hypothetical protein
MRAQVALISLVDGFPGRAFDNIGSPSLWTDKQTIRGEIIIGQYQVKKMRFRVEIRIRI